MKKNYPLRRISLNLKYFLVLVIFLIISNFAVSQNQKCDVGFDVVNNKDFKYAGKSGAHFKFIVTNKSNSVDTYIIYVNNADSEDNSLLNKQQKIKGKRLNLPSKLIIDTKKENVNSSKIFEQNNSKLMLNPNEEALIVLRIDVPEGTEFGGINTSNVTLKSTNCKNISITKQVIIETVDGE